MAILDPNKLWFNTPNTETLCRGGGNGPQHPSQLSAIRGYVKSGMSFLDYGCGSGTTLETLIENEWLHASLSMNKIKYKGKDIIPKNVEWCKKQWPDFEFEVEPQIHKIGEPDESWDVVYSRHVVDHMKSFEDAMDQHCRVAKQLVIVTLWTGLLDGDEHEIKNIVDQRGLPKEKLYPDEYTNNYSRKKVKEYLQNKEGWRLMELAENVGSEVSGCDTSIVLKRV